MPKVVLYCRVSSADQANEGISLEAQQAKLTAYADLFDLEVADVVIDAGKSGKNLRRPGIQQALKMLKDGKADGIVVIKLDRLTRSLKDWQHLIDNYFGEKCGKSLCSLGDSIDTTTAAGRMVLNMMMTVAQWQREDVGEKTKAVLAHKKAQGKFVGNVSYGYKLAADGDTVIPCEREQSVVAVISSLSLSGLSTRKIANQLNERGITKRDGKEWSHTQVHRIIQSAA